MNRSLLAVGRESGEELSSISSKSSAPLVDMIGTVECVSYPREHGVKECQI